MAKICELCSGTGFTLLVEARGTNTMRDIFFKYLKCESCGVVHLEECGVDDNLQPADFKEFVGNTAPLLRGVHAMLSAFFMDMRARVAEKAQKLGRILDVGYGNGAFLLKMRQRGWECSGIDTSPYASGAVPLKQGLNLHCGKIQEIDLPDAYFDLVTFWHSFEHLSEPSQALRRTHSLLKKGGAVFISTPNVSSLEARLSFKNWLGLQPPYHVYLYSPETLAWLLRKFGFSVVYMSKNSLEYNFAILAQTLFNILGGEFNLLEKIFKRYRSNEKTNLLLRIYTVLLICATLPFMVAGTVAMYGLNRILNNGPLIEIIACKDE